MQRFKLAATVGCMALMSAILMPVARAAVAAPMPAQKILPATASILPSIALLGMIALAGAFMLRIVRTRPE
jgi:hypothetical protein